MTGQFLSRPDVTRHCPVVSGHGTLSRNSGHHENQRTKRGTEVLMFCLNLAYII